MHASIPPMPILNNPDATQVLESFKNGTLTLELHVKNCLEQLEGRANNFHAATEILADEARMAIREARGGALAGLAFSVKETIGLAGKPITAGSMARNLESAHGASAGIAFRVQSTLEHACAAQIPIPYQRNQKHGSGAARKAPAS